MCAYMHCPDGEYLAGLRPERLVISDAYAASGRRILFLMDRSCTRRRIAQIDWRIGSLLPMQMTSNHPCCFVA